MERYELTAAQAFAALAPASQEGNRTLIDVALALDDGPLTRGRAPPGPPVDTLAGGRPGCCAGATAHRLGGETRTWRTG